MIGRCPHCGISLKEPPFNGRETNEVVITLRYRNIVENNIPLMTVDQKGYCDVCKANLRDIKEQVESLREKTFL